MKKHAIAILGSTSHIAKGLINNFPQSEEFVLHLYSRSPEKVLSFLKSLGKCAGEGCVVHEGYADFLKHQCAAVINCVGVGTLKGKGAYSDYFTVTEEYDNLVIGFLRNVSPGTLYISLSSGAVYGGEFLTAADGSTVHEIPVNHIAPEDYYAIARLNAEAKHRSLNDFNIVDLRIFSYFSRFADLNEGYFITEIIDCIVKNKVFMTDAASIVRDYVHPLDLFTMIKLCIQAGRINDVFDVCSLKPVEKNEILVYFASEYGLRYEVQDALSGPSPTGRKTSYYSSYDKAGVIGHKPTFTSMDTIAQESKYIIRAHEA